MKLKTLGYTALIVGALAGGVAVGHYATLDREYRIDRSDGVVNLVDNVSSNRYLLRRIDDEVYLGSAAHNFQGVKALAHVEGSDSVMPLVELLVRKNQDLEDKIAKRQTLDSLEATAAAVRNSYMNFRHNTLRD
ncbi:MAG: hypothetical protein ACMXYG_04535 [Candidatus Woesearchaeota archaeon]